MRRPELGKNRFPHFTLLVLVRDKVLVRVRAVNLEEELFDGTDLNSGNQESARFAKRFEVRS